MGFYINKASSADSGKGLIQKQVSIEVIQAENGQVALNLLITAEKPIE
ncbi:hypothetical protein [Colwellia sp.]|nr:hypothetical protein [Colwellia sp.]